ncbi:MAG TPA: hypothetical protein VE944_15660 [Nostoc sp.]|uniref:hypothetical protein n=1 Tax=Nostoc sp. TaxID=1180 RepID=UPI002D70E30B|nr:hypothetical protein [Nostoc sp.]HYX15770.1 hypothetical protein [Nostoc sp.]
MDSNEIIRQRLNERGYFIQETLGVGGFGMTYLTRDKINKENLFVIKTINISNELLQFNKKDSLNRSINSFRNEASILLYCKHENIVKIYSILNE